MCFALLHGVKKELKFKTVLHLKLAFGLLNSLYNSETSNSSQGIKFKEKNISTLPFNSNLLP